MSSEANETANPLPHAGTMPVSNAREEEDSFDISEKKSINLPVLICWLTAILAISGGILFWLLSKSAGDALSEKKSERDEVIAQINSPSLADVEQKASVFKSAVTNLAAVKNNQFLMSDFLTELYARVITNAVISNLSVTTDGKLSMDGRIDSYRAVADQILAVKEWKNENDVPYLKNVQLVTSSQAVNQKTKKIEVSFAITGIVNKAANKKRAAVENTMTPDVAGSSAGATNPSAATEGGSNATIQ